VYEPGYRRLQQNGRLLRRAAEHGVWPLNWQDLELPANVGIVQVGLPKKRTPWWRHCFVGQGCPADSLGLTGPGFLPVSWGVSEVRFPLYTCASPITANHRLHLLALILRLGQGRRRRSANQLWR
jgi:hypothetical protein